MARGDVGVKDTAELKLLLDWQEQRWGQEHPKVIATLEALADMLQMQQKYVEAEPLYWQILEKKHKLYGANDLRVADTIYDLACLHELQENWMECERLYKWTCDIRCKLLPAGDNSLDESVNKVKEIASKQGQDPNSVSFPSRDRTQTTVAVTPFDWQTYLERARMLIIERDYPLAESILSCLTDVADAYQPGTLSQAESMHLLARVQFHRKNVEDGLKTYEKTLALYEKVCGTVSKETAGCLEDMADLHCKLSEKSQADFLFKWALQILEAIPDAEKQASRVRLKIDSIDELCTAREEEPEAPLPKKVEQVLVNPGNAKPKEAEPAEEEAPRSEDQVASFLWNQYVTTGKKALEKGDLAGAEIMLSRALDKANEFGFQDPRLWQTFCDTASVYLAQGKKVRAESLYKSAQQLCEKTHGPMHPDNAKYWEMLGNLYEKTGENGQAVICFDKLVTILVKANRPLVEYGSYLKKLERLHEKPPASFYE